MAAESAIRLPVTEEEEVEEDEGEEEEALVEDRRPTPRRVGGDAAAVAALAAMGLPVTPRTKGSRSAMVKVALLRLRVVGVLEPGTASAVVDVADEALEVDVVDEASFEGDE